MRKNLIIGTVIASVIMLVSLIFVMPENTVGGMIVFLFSGGFLALAIWSSKREMALHNADALTYYRMKVGDKFTEKTGGARRSSTIRYYITTDVALSIRISWDSEFYKKTEIGDEILVYDIDRILQAVPWKLIFH